MLSIEYQIREVEQLIKAGRTEKARAACAALLGESQSDPHVWRLAADVAMRTGAKAEALQYLRRALQCAPGNIELLIQLGHYNLSMGRRADARIAALEATLGTTDCPALLDSLGTLLTHCGEPDRALALFERAVRSSPTEPLFRYNLAMAQRMVGDLEAAEANLDVFLSANPNDGEAQNARSSLRTQTLTKNHVAELQSALSRLQGGPGSVAAEFALAKELEDLGDFARSFSHLSSACGRVRASLQYDVSGDVAVLEALAHEHTAGRLTPVASSIDAEQCIFIVGLPRSGTTLVERILGIHSQVYSAGELEFFPNVIVEAVTRQERSSVGKLDFVKATLKLNFNEIGEAYLAVVRNCIGEVNKFTDKLPFNYLYAGLIHAALPGAKFVAIERNPIDVCYAMYKTLFASAYPFSYDLLDLARYYVSWNRLMRHWANTIGSAWLALSYEDLISQQEKYSRILLSHCGLEWEPQCLDFHQHSRPVTTASAAQVRRPLYSNSVGKWRAYEEELEPLMRYLESHGVACRA
jgi:tetratricopeptide (TPR) repeat protein